jgi:ELWxxDGT repeat protein
MTKNFKPLIYPMLLAAFSATAQTTPTLLIDINKDGSFKQGSLADIGKNYFMPTKNGSVFFFAKPDGDFYDEQPYVTDGTAAGTSLIDETIFSDLGHEQVYDPKTKLIYFTARKDIFSTAKEDTELWVTDGTVAGTKMLKDIEPGLVSSSPTNLTVSNGLLYFKVNEGSNKGLWVSNGTEAGTIQLSTKTPYYIVSFANKAYISMQITSFNTELWESDGTVAGTKKIWVASSGKLGVIYATNNNFYIESDNNFSRFDLVSKTPTVLIKTNISGAINNQGLVSVGKKDFFATSKYWSSAATTKNMIYTTDGTAAGTKSVKELPNSLEATILYAAENFVAFNAPDAADYQQLWLSDGTAAGTNTVELNKGAGSEPSSFCRVGNRIYFAAQYKDAAGKTYGKELMITDGTVAGTKLAFDIDPVGDGKVAAITYLPFKGKPTLFFYASPSSAIDQEPHTLEVNLITPTAEATENNFAANVFPNPSNGLVSVYAEDLSNIIVQDVLGRTLLSKQNCNNSEQIQLPSGIFFLMLKNKNNQSISKKVIIE